MEPEQEAMRFPITDGQLDNLLELTRKDLADLLPKLPPNQRRGAKLAYTIFRTTLILDASR